MSGVTSAWPKTVTDARGRKLEVREMTPGQVFRAIRLQGAQNRNNAAFRFTMIACALLSVEGVPAPFISTEDEAGQTLDLLGDDGFAAINELLYPTPPPPVPGQPAPGSAQETLAVAKN